jgi:hypothetical protein
VFRCGKKYMMGMPEGEYPITMVLPMCAYISQQIDLGDRSKSQQRRQTPTENMFFVPSPDSDWSVTYLLLVELAQRLHILNVRCPAPHEGPFQTGNGSFGPSLGRLPVLVHVNPVRETEVMCGAPSRLAEPRLARVGSSILSFPSPRPRFSLLTHHSRIWSQLLLPVTRSRSRQLTEG